jgi:hypothetical protein
MKCRQKCRQLPSNDGGFAVNAVKMPSPNDGVAKLLADGGLTPENRGVPSVRHPGFAQKPPLAQKVGGLPKK